MKTKKWAVSAAVLLVAAMSFAACVIEPEELPLRITIINIDDESSKFAAVAISTSLDGEELASAGINPIINGSVDFDLRKSDGSDWISKGSYYVTLRIYETVQAEGPKEEYVAAQKLGLESETWIHLTSLTKKED
jgi:hypothetical protein